MGLKEIQVKLDIPLIGSVSGTWAPDEKERSAAWEIYVELITRISIVELKPNEGVLREALSSLHSLFATIRDILKRYGPDIAKPKEAGGLSLAYIAIAILNFEIRPILSKWHPLLLDYEQSKAREVSQTEHESQWEKSEELRNCLNMLRSRLMIYASLLAEAAQVPNFLHEESRQ